MFDNGRLSEVGHDMAARVQTVAERAWDACHDIGRYVAVRTESDFRAVVGRAQRAGSILLYELEKTINDEEPYDR